MNASGLQRYVVYRESMLSFASQKAWAAYHIAHVSPRIVPQFFSVLPGFASTGEAILFRQNDPRPLTRSPASSDGADENHG